jgi:hypothetical protein
MRFIKLPELIFLTLLLGLFLTGCATLVGSPPEDGDAAVSETEGNNKIDREFRIVTLLPKDAIPSIDNPHFYTVEEADQEYDPDEIVLGVVFGGEARAYSVNMLSSHEIVNDVVAGVPIAVTW